MTQFSVLMTDSPQDVEQWREIWERWPAREVFAHPNYLRLFESENEKAACALLTSANGTVIYPFFLRKVDTGRYPNLRDLSSPYGYGGAVAIDGANKTALEEEFWTNFDEWCAQSHVVSEFVRFTLFPESLLRFPGEVEDGRENVVRALEMRPEDLWMDFDHKVRKNVKKAQRSGVTIDIDYDGSHFEGFYQIYLETMDRRSASSRYYFEEKFFREIHRSLIGQFVYFHARHEGKIISTELILVSEQSVYSFLGGTSEVAFDKRPNDLLKYEAMVWAAKQGKKNFVLGGGYAPGDGIFKYKRAFAPDGCVPFRIGRRIMNQPVYDALVREKSSENSGDVPKGYFPAYRA